MFRGYSAVQFPLSVCNSPLLFPGVPQARSNKLAIKPEPLVDSLVLISIKQCRLLANPGGLTLVHQSHQRSITLPTQEVVDPEFLMLEVTDLKLLSDRLQETE